MEKLITAAGKLTIGLELRNPDSHYCMLDEAGHVVSEGNISTTKSGIASLFAYMPPCYVVLEAGSHSPWVTRLVEGLGHEVIVTDPAARLILPSAS